jgi:hypothetical protein
MGSRDHLRRNIRTECQRKPNKRRVGHFRQRVVNCVHVDGDLRAAVKFVVPTLLLADLLSVVLVAQLAAVYAPTSIMHSPLPSLARARAQACVKFGLTKPWQPVAQIEPRCQPLAECITGHSGGL